MRPRILIVEDEEAQRLGFALTIRHISAQDRHEAGIDDFDIDSASNREEALALLSRAKGDATPYDVLLLDLSLPPSPVDDRDNPRHGLRTLEHAIETQSAKEIIVITVHSEYAVQAFRHGASDFVIKNTLDVEFQTRFLASWKRLVVRESIGMLDQRVRDLVRYAEVGLAHRFGVCFASVIQSVEQELEELSRALGSQFGLDSSDGAHDPLLRHVVELRRAINDGSAEWLKMQSGIEPPLEIREGISIDELLRDIVAHLNPCFVAHHITVDLADSSGARVLSFRDDVRAVLQEMLLGAVQSLKDAGRGDGAIRIAVERAASRVKVTFTDTAPTLAHRDAQFINAGLAISPDGLFRREWGLSVVQHVALWGGGKLAIEPAPDDTGNIVAYSIPGAS